MSVPSFARDLTQPELAEFVASYANQRQRWEHLIHHDPEQRIFEESIRTEFLSVWVICWSAAHDTGFHDHDRSSGAVAVVEGTIREERLRIGREPVRNTYAPGSSFSFSASDIHRVVHAGAEPAITVHAYSPPLANMGSYVVEDDGALKREPLGAGTELKPLAPAA